MDHTIVVLFWEFACYYYCVHVCGIYTHVFIDGQLYSPGWLWVSSSISVHFILQDRLSHWTWSLSCCFGQTSWPAGSQEPPVSDTPRAELQTDTIKPLFYMGAEIWNQVSTLAREALYLQSHPPASWALLAGWIIIFKFFPMILQCHHVHEEHKQ